jgi:hypothetical protein
MFYANKQRSTHSIVGIATRLSRVHILSGIRHFPVFKVPRLALGPHNLTFNGNQVALLGIKLLVHKVNISPPSSAEA